jgi:osmoprotectant transport system substrate-binding protein
VLRDEAITIGSFDFLESELLAEVYALALEEHGVEIERTFNLGPRELVQPALAAGLIEFVPEYSGTALQFMSLGEAEPRPDVDATHDALIDVLAGGSMAAMTPAPAQDANVFVVSRETADRYGLASLTDLRDAASNLTFGGPPECPVRPFCLLGLEEVYGVKFDRFIALDAGGPLTHQALRNGYVDVALLFTTDPELIGSDLVKLTDDLSLQPAENVTPIVRREVIAGWGPEFEQVVNDVSSRLTTSELRQLNARAAEGIEPSKVAQEWLTSWGYLP